MKMYPNWRTKTCFNCSGCGQESEYTYFGDDFLGPKECSVCDGKGFLWISPKGRIADYPGGPFRGMALLEETK